ncbi:MAG TPA: MFS transporter [Alphaproteobacteria bacterium]|nr:MFS transporter [Alphaproteobacteria bacterium]
MSVQHRLLGAAVVGFGTLLGPLDSAVNVAFPHITDAFGRPVEAIQWVVICYTLTYSSLMLVCGKLGDRFGHRRVFGLGLAISAAGLALCAVAPGYGWLLGFRALQGVGTALVLSCSAALAIHLFDERLRSRVLAGYTMLFGLGAMFGPTMGGLLTQGWGWPSVFWFRVPAALLPLALLRWLPASPPQPARGGFDLAGAGFIVLGLGTALLALNRMQDGGNWLAVGGLVLAAALAAALFVRQESRSADPIIRLEVFANPEFALLHLANLMVNLVAFAVLLLVPYYLARVLGLAPALSGVVLAIAPTGFVAASLLGGWLAGRLGAERRCLLAAILLVIGLAAVGRWTAAPGLALLALPLLLTGFGQGLFQLSYTDAVIARLPAEERGVAGSIAMLTRTVGIVSGAALLTMLFSALQSGAAARGAGLADAFLGGFTATFDYAAALLAGFLLLSLLRPHTWSSRLRRRGEI